jgi:oligopeptide transport system ATP-binding protein
MNATAPLLIVENLKKYFVVRKRGPQRGKAVVQAVDDVSFNIHEGETLGLVGESGCGKTTVGRTVLRLYRPTSGRVSFRVGNDTVDITSLPQGKLKGIRRQMQIIYQDPYSSLNPRMTIGSLLEEPMIVHGVRSRDERRERVLSILSAVGMKAEHVRRYPHEFSGGQRQRIAIARSLVLHPSLVVADEPVSSLDVSIQAQVLNLLEDLQKELGLTYLFVAHNLSVVKHISDRIAVMYLGKIVEISPTDDLFRRPRHPYTEALMSAIPVPDPDLKMHRIALQGDVPSPINPPSGCRFHPRCKYAEARCSNEEPKLKDVGNGHFAACHFAETLTLESASG